MASGKTLELRQFATQMFWTQVARSLEPRETRPRNRSLNGKARIRARRAARV